VGPPFTLTPAISEALLRVYEPVPPRALFACERPFDKKEGEYLDEDLDICQVDLLQQWVAAYGRFVQAERVDMGEPGDMVTMGFFKLYKRYARR
jgi:hypothetical protein